MWIHTYIHMYTLYTHICICIYTSIHIHTYIYTHTNTCAQIYTCTHRYTHMWRECIRSIFYTKKKKNLLKYKSYEEGNMLYTFKLPNFAYSISLLSLNVTNSSLLSSQLLLQLLLPCSIKIFENLLPPWPQHLLFPLLEISAFLPMTGSSWFQFLHREVFLDLIK